MNAKEKKVIRLALKWYTSSGMEGRHELWESIAELYGDKAAEQNMHWTAGIVRRFRDFSVTKFILSLWHSLASRQ